MPLNQSIVLPIMKPDSIDLGAFLDEIKAIGINAVEIWHRQDDFETLLEATHRRGIKVVSMVGHTHHSPTDGNHAEAFSRRHNHDRLEAELRESIDIAVQHDIPSLITLSGHRDPGLSDDESLMICAEGLRRIAPYAEEKKISLNMELLNSKIEHPNYLCDNTTWAIALCEAVNSPCIKILYDIYHMSIMEGDLIRNIQRAAPWIGHYHTAGNPGRSNLDDFQEINYPGICRAINATGYDLYLGHEFRTKGNYITAIQQAYDCCHAE